jgi:triacylglycerol esterase/lipase EstA (alpha/beta hydrolase family)
MTIKEALLDPNIKKVVVIAHSQGGIIILSDLPRECPTVEHDLS